ncbi:hypothetical protein Q5P01_009876 [Channa striata]|uniref:Uncharacterized protein n=1 Tax=Channa striata TaxID=64152 RepID=A0AA88MYR3_CHASR|nr:hypothetical protein Q5P01_009876 [Channa striata]
MKSSSPDRYVLTLSSPNVSGPCGEKMAAVEKKREESPKTKLSAWDPRVADADSVTLHPWEISRYGQRDGASIYYFLAEP